MSGSLSDHEHPPIRLPSNTVFKCGPLLISSKGIGWKSWKKRWFILTRTSLVFFKNDPSALPHRGGEVNLTLGGIDLNNSGRIVVREDKKLLTVLFPDGRDGRAFTLKAESSEDLDEWRTALESALSQAPSAALVIGNDGIFRNDTNETIEGSLHQWRDKRNVKSMVVGRPILLALEDIDGGPSFLEKALRYLEAYGSKVEGILRQAADVEEVERRVKDYEQGKTDFGDDEDAHVVGDCVKHVLRELPSSPVPASCCTALLEANRVDRKEVRVNAIRSAIFETFPDPNRRLLQRILKMMHIISSHTSENRMTSSAVAACMAPLLLRPLLAGECELDEDFDVNGDNSAQLLAAAYAANNAQSIIVTLLEEYQSLFDDGNLQRCSISADSRIESSDSDDSIDVGCIALKDKGSHNTENKAAHEINGDRECLRNRQLCESSSYVSTDLYDSKVFNGDGLETGSPRSDFISEVNSNLFARESNVLIEQQTKQEQGDEHSVKGMVPLDNLLISESYLSMGELLSTMEPGIDLPQFGPESYADKRVDKSIGSSLKSNAKPSSFWGRSTGRKTPSMESVDSSGEEEISIQKLEITKKDLRQRIAKEARGNAILQASLERRKQALHERRLTLEQDVVRLQDQLQAEKDLRAALEGGLSMPSEQFSSSRGMDSKTRAELEEITAAEADVSRLKQKVAELHHQLNQQRQRQHGPLPDTSERNQPIQNQNSKLKFRQQDFDVSFSYSNHDRKQTTEENLVGADWRSHKGQVPASGSSNGRKTGIKQILDSNVKESTSNVVNELSVNSAFPSSTSRVMEYPRQPSATSSALVELTTRLDFFKERRSQLMEQLNRLDLSYGSVSSKEFS